MFVLVDDTFYLVVSSECLCFCVPSLHLVLIESGSMPMIFGYLEISKVFVNFCCFSGWFKDEEFIRVTCYIIHAFEITPPLRMQTFWPTVWLDLYRCHCVVFVTEQLQQVLFLNNSDIFSCVCICSSFFSVSEKMVQCSPLWKSENTELVTFSAIMNQKKSSEVKE